MASLGGGQRDMYVDDIRVGDLADRDADIAAVGLDLVLVHV